MYPVVFQIALNDCDEVAASNPPSIYTLMLATATLSAAVALIVVVPDTVELATGARIITVGGTVSLTTETFAVAPVDGSVIVSAPVEVPAVTIIEAAVALVTACDVMLAPLPPLKVNVGLPGVPDVQGLPLPVRLMTLPVVPAYTGEVLVAVSDKLPPRLDTVLELPVPAAVTVLIL